MCWLLLNTHGRCISAWCIAFLKSLVHIVIIFCWWFSVTDSVLQLPGVHFITTTLHINLIIWIHSLWLVSLLWIITVQVRNRISHWFLRCTWSHIVFLVGILVWPLSLKVLHVFSSLRIRGMPSNLGFWSESIILVIAIRWVLAWFVFLFKYSSSCNYVSRVWTTPSNVMIILSEFILFTTKISWIQLTVSPVPCC